MEITPQETVYRCPCGGVIVNNNNNNKNGQTRNLSPWVGLHLSVYKYAVAYTRGPSSLIILMVSVDVKHHVYLLYPWTPIVFSRENTTAANIIQRYCS